MDGRNSQSLLSQMSLSGLSGVSDLSPAPSKKKARRGADPANQKRRCVSTACVACRKRKSKCDGALPSCAACSSVYGTECIYDPNSDHRRKGVYREKVDSMKAQSSTLQILIEAILNAAEEDVPAIVKQIRTCDSLDTVAEAILKQDFAQNEDEDEGSNLRDDDAGTVDQAVEGERELARKMGELRLENGSVRFIGGTSHLIYLGASTESPGEPEPDNYFSDEDPITSWSEVSKNSEVIDHLIKLYFDWHYPYFTTLSKSLFYRDFQKGKPRAQPRTTTYCSSLLVNAMLALGCHFTSIPDAFGIPGDSRTKGDHFFAEAKRLIIENDEYEKPRLTTVQALALMSVREAGCGREAKGWVYSGMSFRMAQDIGLNLNIEGLPAGKDSLNEQEVDARRITFWGCFLFDKCWSNYLGRLPQLPKNSYNVPKYDVFPDEDAEPWSPYTDTGPDDSLKQPSRTRAVALQLTKLCEISSDLLLFFYHPNHIGRSSGKTVELKKLSELHRRLEEWRKELPKEFEPKEGQLPNVILVHMFFHLQYIHLFRPFLKYSPTASPLPSHISPRRICSANAGAISKLMRLYKKTYNLRQICNIAVYMIHSACTIHMLNLPEKTAKRDITHGVKQLEEIAEDWPCARRTLSIISVLARKWNVDMPEEASVVLQRTDEKYGTFSTSDVPSPLRQPPPVANTPSPQSIANSPPQAKNEQDSPANPYNITQHAPTQQMPGPLSSDFLNSFAMPSPVSNNRNHNHIQKQRTHAVAPSAGGLSMNDALSAVPTSWAMPSVTTQSMGSFTQRFPTPISNGMPSTQASQTATRQVSPSSLYAIDGQEWYLKDGVNWQQNFETWDLGVPAVQARTSVTNAAAAGGGIPDSNSMYMFRGLRGDFTDGAFDSLNMSMSNLDNLPNLD